jgi:hypothetical protein
MAKDKYKRKQRRAQQKAQQSAARILVVEKEKMATDETKQTTHATAKAANDKKPIWYVRFWRYVTGSSTVTNWLIVLFTGVLAGSAIYQFVIMRGQLTKMQQQIEQAENQFTISHRPWVGIADVAKVIEPLTFDSTGAHVDITFSIKNGGSSPALRVNPILGLVISTYRTLLSDANAMIQRECSIGVEMFSHTNVGNPLLLPGDTIELPTTVSTERKDFHFGPTDNSVEAWLILSIIYQDDLGKPHCSAFAQAYKTDGGQYTLAPAGVIKGRFTRTGFGHAD